MRHRIATVEGNAREAEPQISPAWSPKLQDETGYQESQIKSCAKEMCALLQAAEKASLQVPNNSGQQN